MTTSSQTETPTRAGDICPTWCSGSDHRVCRDAKTHLDDAGSYHESPRIDTWRPSDVLEQDPANIEVYIRGFRHDSGDDEGWIDEVYAENVHPGFLSGVGLPPVDARRLGLALVAAADLAEASA